MIDVQDEPSMELPVEELLDRARPLPPHDEMVIDELSEEEGRASLEELARARGRTL